MNIIEIAYILCIIYVVIIGSFSISLTVEHILRINRYILNEEAFSTYIYIVIKFGVICLLTFLASLFVKFAMFLGMWIN